MVSRSHHWLHQFQLVTEHSLKGDTNYGNRATGVGRGVSRPFGLRPKRIRILGGGTNFLLQGAIMQFYESTALLRI